MIPDINLLPKYERQSSITYILFIAGLIITLSLAAVLLFFYFDKRGTLEDANEGLTELKQKRTILEEQLTALESDSRLVTLESVIDYAERHIVPTSAFIDELVTLLPENSYLSNYDYNYQMVGIETQFETMRHAATYINELEKSEYVIDVRVGRMNTFELGPEEQDEDERANTEAFYSTIPRYNVSYSIEVDQAYLREAGESDE